MRRRSRTRRGLKWVGTAVCLLISIGWVWSVQHSCDIYNDKSIVYLVGGRLLIAGPSPVTPAGPLQFNYYYHGPDTWNGLGFTWPHMSTDPYWGREYILPLWLVLTLAALPTGLLWRWDRRVPKGHCQKCGYDLTGNVSGRCPECGTPVPDTSAEGESA